MASEGFVGRTAELDLLDAQLEEARSGRPRVVFLAGGAGIGKTALVRHFIGEHHRDGRVLETGGDEAESNLAFAVVERLVTGLSASLEERLTDIVAGTAAAPDPLGVGVEILGELGTLQDEEPLVIFLDDAQWADRPSLTALTFVLRRLRADRVLTFVALRPGSQTLLPPGLLRLADDDRGSWLWLGGLEPAELQKLSVRAGTGELAPWMARRLHEQTEGNPLYALTILRELGADILGGDDPLPPPPSLSLLVLSQLSGCSEPAVRLARAAAVLGRNSLLGVAAGLADVEQPLDAVEELAAAGLLALEERRGERYISTHPLIRAVVYADLGPAQRAGLHARAATLLGGDEAVEHRVRASGPGDVALAAELRDRAADETARGAWSAAAHHLLAASRLESSAEARSACLLEAAMLMLGGVDVGGVLALQDTILALPPSPRRSYVLGHVTFYTGKPAEAEGLFAEALQTADHHVDPEVAAASAVWLSQGRLLAMHGLEAVELARVALGLAPVGSPIWELAQGAERVGMGIAGLARPALAEAASEPTRGSTMEGFVALTGTGILRLWTDDLNGARRDLAAVETFIVKRGPISVTFPALFYLAEAEFRAGAWDDALAHAHHHASLAADSDALYAAPYAEAMMATIYALRGRWEAAEQHLAALAAVPAGGDTASLGYASLAAAQLASARGDSAAVLRDLGPLIEMGDADGMREPGVMPWRDLYAEALLRSGRVDEAEKVLVELEGLAKERELASGMAAAARIRGDLEAARGARTPARAAFQAGLEQAKDVGMPFLQARLAMDYGAFLRRSGERRVAVEVLEEAAEIFSTLRSEPFLQRCERELEGSDRQRAPRGTSHLTLTPQELAVARLVARGLSNRAAASELVLSVKTIEYHLSNLYAKLGVSSRTQLVARLAETGQIDFQP